jgi:hypothetical protein
MRQGFLPGSCVATSVESAAQCQQQLARILKITAPQQRRTFADMAKRRISGMVSSATSMRRGLGKLLSLRHKAVWARACSTAAGRKQMRERADRGRELAVERRHACLSVSAEPL